MLWGFSSVLVYRAISRRTGGQSRKLGVHSIEAIHKAWQRVAFYQRKSWLVRCRRSIYTKDSLERLTPRSACGMRRRSLADLADELLANSGELQSSPVDWLVPPMTIGEMDAEDIPEILRPFYAAGTPRAGYIEDRQPKLTPAAEANTKWFIPRDKKRGT